MRKIKCWLGFHDWRRFDHTEMAQMYRGPQLQMIPLWTEKRRHCRVCHKEEWLYETMGGQEVAWTSVGEHKKYKPTESDKAEELLKRYE
jgi:hypothetical protein